MYRLKVVLTLFLTLTLLSGCALTRRPELTVPFETKAAALVEQTGRADIRGEAFVEKPNGKVLRARGRDVFLVAATDHAQEWITSYFGSMKLRYLPHLPADLKGEFNGYARVEITSSGGRFTFKDVADGEYFLITNVTLPSKYSYVFITLYERVSVVKGKSVRVVMRGY